MLARLYGNLADPFDGQRTVLQQFWHFIYGLLICLLRAVRKLQPSSRDAGIYEYEATKGLKEYFCVVTLLWPMPVVTTTIVVKRVLHLSL